MPIPLRDRLRSSPALICASTGVFGTLLGFALFVLWEEKLEEGETFALFLVSLVLAVLMASWGEWLIELIHHSPAAATQHDLRGAYQTDPLPRILLYLLVLAVVEISVMAVHALAKSSEKYADLFARFSIGNVPSDRLWYLLPQIGLWLVIGGILGGRLAIGFAHAPKEKRYSLLYGAKIGAVTGTLYVFGAVFCYSFLIRAFGVIDWIWSDPDSWKSSLASDRKRYFNDDFLSSLIIDFRRLAGWLIGGSIGGSVLFLALLVGVVGLCIHAWRYRRQSFRGVLISCLIGLCVFVLVLVGFPGELLVRSLAGGVLAIFLWLLPAVFLGMTLPFLEALAAVQLNEIPPALRSVVLRIRELDRLPALWIPIAVATSAALVIVSIWSSSYWILGVSLILLAAVALSRPPDKTREYWPVMALLVFSLLGTVTTLGQHASFFSIQAQMRLINPPTPSLDIEEMNSWSPGLYLNLLLAELKEPPKNLEAIVDMLRENKAWIDDYDRTLAAPQSVSVILTTSLGADEYHARKKIDGLLELELWVQLDLVRLSSPQCDCEKVRAFIEEMKQQQLLRVATELKPLTPAKQAVVQKIINDGITDSAKITDALRPPNQTTAGEIMALNVLSKTLPGLVERKLLLDARLNELTTSEHSDRSDFSAPERLQLAIVVSVGFWLTVGLLAGWSAVQMHRRS